MERLNKNPIPCTFNRRGGEEVEINIDSLFKECSIKGRRVSQGWSLPDECEENQLVTLAR